MTDEPDSQADTPPGSESLDFAPVPVRPRHDGWTPDRQTAFIDALAESGCVDEACKRVGIAVTSAYRLRRRIDAQSFRIAWDAALDYGVRRLSDAAFSRALKGVARPVFFQGQQIGERRYYDERLTMFLLRYRDPLRYGKWLDGCEYRQHPDGPAIRLSKAGQRVESDAFADADGEPRPLHPPLSFPTVTTPEKFEQEEEERWQAVRRRAADRRTGGPTGDVP